MQEKKQMKIVYGCEILTATNNHWAFFPLYIALVGTLNSYFVLGKPSVLFWIILNLVPIYTFFIRLKWERFVPFLFFNIIPILGACILPVPHMAYRVIGIVCAIAYFIQNFSIRIKATTIYTNAFSPVVIVCLSVFCIVFLHYISDEDWNSYILFGMIGSLALSLLLSYLKHYMAFLTVNASSAGSMPADEMFHSGLNLALLYSFSTALLLLLAANFSYLENIWNFVKKGLIAFLRFLFSLGGGKRTEEEIVTEMSQGNNDSPMEMLAGDAEPFFLWEILEKIAIVAFALALVYVIIRLSVFLVKFLKEKFSLSFKRTKTVREEHNSFDIREKCEIASNKSSRFEKRFTLFDALSPCEKIRRIYRKKVEQAFEQTAEKALREPSFYTAREAENVLSLQGIAPIYELARYSNHPVTSSDVKQLKLALNKKYKDL